MVEVFENIDRIRKEKLLRHGEVAEKAGMSPQTYNIIRKHGNPSLRTLNRIAKALEVSPRAFFNERA